MTVDTREAGRVRGDFTVLGKVVMSTKTAKLLICQLCALNPAAMP